MSKILNLVFTTNMLVFSLFVYQGSDTGDSLPDLTTPSHSFQEAGTPTVCMISLCAKVPNVLDYKFVSCYHD